MSPNKRKKPVEEEESVKKARRIEDLENRKTHHKNIKFDGGVWKAYFGNKKLIGEYATKIEAIEARNSYYLALKKYPGVSVQNVHQWVARMTLNGKLEVIGYYKKFEQAVDAVKQVEESENAEKAIRSIQRQAAQKAKENTRVILSNYINVKYIDGKWKAYTNHKHLIGEYDTEAKAVAARDIEYLKRSKYPGVTINNRNQCVAKMRINGKLETIGYYKEFKEAVAIIKRVEASSNPAKTILEIQNANEINKAKQAQAKKAFSNAVLSNPLLEEASAQILLNLSVQR